MQIKLKKSRMFYHPGVYNRTRLRLRCGTHDAPDWVRDTSEFKDGVRRGHIVEVKEESQPCRS